MVIIFQSWQPLYNLMEQKTELFIVIVSLMMAAEVSINLVFLALSSALHINTCTVLKYHVI